MNLKKKNGWRRRKNEDFPCGISEIVSRTKSAKELHMKKHNDKTSQYTPSPTNTKIDYTRCLSKSCKVLKRTENKPKVHTNTVHASVRNIIPKETPKRPIQHDGKLVKSPERKSFWTEPKTIKIKIKCNSNKEEFNEQGTADGEEINVNIVTMAVKLNQNICSFYSPKQDSKTRSWKVT